MRIRFITLSALALATLALAASHALAAGPKGEGLSPKALDGLVASVVEAHGGLEALRAVKALKVASRIEAKLEEDKGEGVVLFVRPDKLLSDNRYGKGREVRILNGRRGWIMTEGGEFQEAPPGAMMGMLYSLATYKLPLELKDKRDRLSYLGKVVQLGKSFDVVELDYSESLRVRVYVEAETRRIAQVAGYIKVGGRTVVLSRVLGDYRLKAGVLYPFHQLFYGGAALIAEKWVGSIEVNPPVPNGAFGPET